MRRVALGVFVVAAMLGGCRRGPELRSAWRTMPTRQVSYALDAAPTVLEIRSAAGWVERVELRREADAAASGRGDSVRIGEDLPVPDDVRIALLSAMGGAAAPGGTDLERAERISTWLVDRIAASNPSGDARASDDASADDGTSVDMLARTTAGSKYTCTTTATILFDAARSAGLVARRVDLATRPGSTFETHALVEIRSRELGRWVVVDPFFNHEYTIDGAPASAFELRNALASGSISRIGVVVVNGRRGVDARTYRIDPLLYFRNVSIRTADGRTLLYRGPGDVAAPVADPLVVQTDDAAPFRPDSPGEATVDPKRRTPSPRVVVQVLGRRTLLGLTADAFAGGPVELRADDGGAPAFDAPLSGYSPDDALVVRPEPIGTGAWAVDGGETASGADGGTLVMSGAAPCRVTIPFSAPDGSTFVAFCDAEVTAGTATFGIAGRRAFATTALEVGERRTVSTPILRSRGSDDALLELGPHSRVTVYSTKVLPARGFLSPEPHGTPRTLESSVGSGT